MNEILEKDSLENLIYEIRGVRLCYHQMWQNYIMLEKKY